MSDIYLRNFPKELIIKIKKAAIDAGLSMKDWIIRACRKELDR